MSAAANPARAQQAEVDSTTIDVPDLNFTPTSKDRGDFEKYFLYWKQNVGFERARADFKECYSYGAVMLFPTMPPFITLDDKPIEGPGSTINSLGLIGALAESYVAGPLARRAAQQRVSMCMGYKGYVRFGTTKALWEQIAQGEREQAILVQVKIASGPMPQGEQVTQ